MSVTRRPAPTNQYLKQFPLGQGFYVPAAGVLRIRVTAAVAVNAYCYVVIGLGGVLEPSPRLTSTQQT